MTFIAITLFVAVSLLIYVRLAPDIIEHWHQDPETVKPTGRPNDYRLAGETSISLNAKQTKVSQYILDYAGKQERTELVANTEDGQLLTFVQRSKLIAYPDYITFKITPQENRSQVSVFSRSRFGYRDFGVNKLRVETWVDGIRRLATGS
ncbi:DUF1499 domain-containing protein [Amylibacter sp. SFDW26]|uniref:DUF1499 domain-containing protein n=1 Tax=Amylibacter sp. SFDW26 TaxID=2652722 RepID=UPI0018698745|nr:DUF1499 domain-containing protein [Amylibacter sp. SFDW26]